MHGTIPTKADTTERRNADAPLGRYANARVLVFDQDADSRKAIKVALLIEGYAVAAASDPAVLRAGLLSLRYDVVVLDHVLKGESPVYLARLVREHQPDAGLVLVTADKSYRRVWGLPGGRGYEFLRKPAQVADVLAAVGRQLGARQP